MDAFPGGVPTRDLLDAVVPDRPVYLPNRDGHGAWVNTMALRRAGITKSTPDPADGRIERDADGQPLGMLQEGAAWLVESSGLKKGYTRGSTGISSKHALAIVNRGGATAADIIALKNEIQERVERAWGIRLEPEPLFVGF